MRRLVTPLLFVGLTGCLWDLDFFDDYSEAGPPAPTVDAAPPPSVDAGPDTGPMAPPSIGRGPDCVNASCGLVTFVGSSSIAGLAADESGGCWVLINGPAAAVHDVNGEQALDPSAPSHLVHIGGGGQSVDLIAPLPFVGTGLEASRAATFVAGHQATAGEILGTPIDPGGRQAIVARVANGGLQWWVTWSSTAAPRIGSAGPTGLWILGEPGNAALHDGDAADPFHAGADPAAPRWFLARLTGLGDLDWLRGFGTNRMVVDGFAVGAGDHGTLAVRGVGALWDDVAVEDGRLLFAQINARGGLTWTLDLPANQFGLESMAVDPGGATWAAFRGDSTADELVFDAPVDATALVVRLAGGSMMHRAAALVGPQQGFIDAIDAAGDVPLLVGQTYGDGETALSGVSLAGTGTVLGAVNGLVRTTWLQLIGEATPNAPLSRHIDGAGGFHCVSTEVFGEVEWGGHTSVYDGRPTAVVMSLPSPR